MNPTHPEPLEELRELAARLWQIHTLWESDAIDTADAGYNNPTETRPQHITGPYEIYRLFDEWVPDAADAIASLLDRVAGLEELGVLGRDTAYRRRDEAIERAEATESKLEALERIVETARNFYIACAEVGDGSSDNPFRIEGPWDATWERFAEAVEGFIPNTVRVNTPAGPIEGVPVEEDG